MHIDRLSRNLTIRLLWWFGFSWTHRNCGIDEDYVDRCTNTKKNQRRLYEQVKNFSKIKQDYCMWAIDESAACKDSCDTSYILCEYAHLFIRSFSSNHGRKRISTIWGWFVSTGEVIVCHVAPLNWRLGPTEDGGWPRELSAANDGLDGMSSTNRNSFGLKVAKSKLHEIAIYCLNFSMCVNLC